MDSHPPWTAPCPGLRAGGRGSAGLEVVSATDLAAAPALLKEGGLDAASGAAPSCGAVHPHGSRGVHRIFTVVMVADVDGGCNVPEPHSFSSL